MKSKERLDLLLVELGHFPTRQKAQACIMAGQVLVNDRPVDKPGTLVPRDAAIRLRGSIMPFVSRGGLKLQHAIQTYPVRVQGAVALDVGISTGGFTDCLLQSGATKVIGVDVGRGQVDWKIRQDPRVVLFEETNFRYFDCSLITDKISLAVVDVSFISLSHILPVLAKILEPGAEAILLIKPQFEVGREAVGAKGVVRDPEVRASAVTKVNGLAEINGFEVLGTTESPVPGPEGNIEFLTWLRRTPSEHQPAADRKVQSESQGRE